MIAYEIETMIREDVSVDIHFDLCGVEEVAKCIANRFAALEAENARLREALHFYSGNHAIPNDGPWGVNSNDFGRVARAALAD